MRTATDLSQPPGPDVERRCLSDSRVPDNGAVPATVHVAFLGCGFITRVHSGHLRRLGEQIVPSYASRDRSRAEAYRMRYGGVGSYGDYRAAIEDSRVDAVVVAVPPRFHLDLTLQALSAGKHVLVEKPAFPGWPTSSRYWRRATGRVASCW